MVRIDHINMDVHNLEESKSWYKSLFDFQEVESGVWDGPNMLGEHVRKKWIILRSGQSMLCLYELPNLEARPSFDEGLQINHFGFQISSVEAFFERLRETQTSIEYGGAQRRPHSTSWYVSDPSGHEIEVTKWDDDQIFFD